MFVLRFADSTDTPVHFFFLVGDSPVTIERTTTSAKLGDNNISLFQALLGEQISSSTGSQGHKARVGWNRKQVPDLRCPLSYNLVIYILEILIMEYSLSFR